MTDTSRPPPSEWHFDDIKASPSSEGVSYVTFRQGQGGPTFFMSPAAAEDVARQLIDAAKQAQAALSAKDDLEGAN